MVIEMTGKPWEPPAVQGGAGERACPVCDKPMLVEVLSAVTIDRCAGHGVYFDPDELQTALQHAAEPHHVGSFLQRLFHRCSRCPPQCILQSHPTAPSLIELHAPLRQYSPPHSAPE